ncbi:flagellar hook-basal body complex protein FliE [Novosphingobium sp. P6W]|uniref:flagellar hook-basal body complex protein FliE n=1 Tax=Novosphingobium sp. P6W TaxID=1609758 RepID=UPI0005C2F961|nr:flagellar hook-basal body complex protein FliE [Novosphingobium sp. P6W]AXB77989.1 flagellar hook-basal body complex protein FliE [Novosphingobium sp. P6W]KIS29807.1 flagellar hook-basal body protein FliE [Novosphingobium sp. P6W]
MPSISGMGGAGGVQQILQLRQQIISRNDLLREIHTAQAATQTQSAGQAPAGGFATSLQTALDGVSSVQSRSEALSTAYEKGEVTDVAKVMLARQEAGVAFEATLQVRNKLLSAYQDIMRMGV